MSANSGEERRARRGPAPIASFDHDASDESSPETKQTFRLPEIREDPAGAVAADGADSLAPPAARPRSLSSPAVHDAPVAPAATATTAGPGPALVAPTAPRIDISRASSSSHHDSRDSSPELALFTGNGGGDEKQARLELGFREDGALDLRSSTEELAFMEGAPGNEETRPPPTAPPSRRHSRKDSQCSETALLAVSGRTSRLSSVGSQCSAHSVLSGFSHTSRVSRLSVVSGASRSPSPHKMLLETSFCGPKPIETDPEICAAAVEERLLEFAKLSTDTAVAALPPTDSRDHREVRTEATVESSTSRSSIASRVAAPVCPTSISERIPSAALTSKPNTLLNPIDLTADEEKRQKETKNRARVEERKSKSRTNTRQVDTHKDANHSKNIIRIKLKPDEDYNDDEDDESDRTLISAEPARKPVSLELNDTSIQSFQTKGASISLSPQMPQRHLRDSRTPSPSGVTVSRKSSFCSLFKSRETIASPDSPLDALKRKKSLNEGRSRSKSRDRSVTPTSSGKIKGSVLSLFKTPRKSVTSPSPSPRDGSPVIQVPRQFPQTPADKSKGEKLKYYEDTKDGIIHIPLRTPPDEKDASRNQVEQSSSRDVPRPSSAPQVRSMPERPASVISAPIIKPIQRTVLPDGSIIIPLHSPTEKKPGSPILKRSESPPVATTVHTQAVIEKQRTEESVPSDLVSPELCSHPAMSPVADEAGAGIKAGWIDFAEVPERRKQPKRIQTLPGARDSGPPPTYVPPERCQCECHAAPPTPPRPHDTDTEDQLPLLQHDTQQMIASTSSSLEGGEEPGRVRLDVHVAPFTRDLDLHRMVDLEHR
ncbi:nucleolar and coiled-body phosphoprotein 1 [Leptidea sinapis]|uniref:nucleolar and coiled-body phosphoprotein 1 n=1 Tax=Leptidea sinapis TaxID=189913 RepID=UPI0021C2C3FB|nr:nucleolar and coiled-body phosphoprotein 1 [Leptidea sinapis]